MAFDPLRLAGGLLNTIAGDQPDRSERRRDDEEEERTQKRVDAFRELEEAHDLAQRLQELCPEGLELQFALSCLEQSMLWAAMAVQRGGHRG